jgi:lycopene beta-cyclase
MEPVTDAVATLLPAVLSLLLYPVQVFLEETSLVARPAVDFPDLKERLEARMKWLGIKVGWGMSPSSLPLLPPSLPC